MAQKRERVLIAKPGLDGHEMGARLISRALMDAGMEVIYSGPRQTPEMVVNTALQEDVSVIGLSYLTGAHKEHTSRIIRLMQSKGMDPGRIVLVVGGIIPPRDVAYLKTLGVDAVFGPGSDTRVITQTIREAIDRKRG
ncbi:MAG: cobalamin B12-binding domain-containing protein [Chloroflexota bacterium]